MFGRINELIKLTYQKPTLALLTYIHVYSFLAFLLLSFANIALACIVILSNNLVLVALHRAVTFSVLLLLAICLGSIGLRAATVGELAWRSKNKQSVFLSSNAARIIGLTLILLSVFVLLATKIA